MMNLIPDKRSSLKTSNLDLYLFWSYIRIPIYAPYQSNVNGGYEVDTIWHHKLEKIFQPFMVWYALYDACNVFSVLMAWLTVFKPSCKL